MNKYFIVGILFLATTQSSIGFANSHCQNDNDGRDDKICKLGKSYREEIENTLKNDIGNSGMRVALSRYHSGTENSRIYKERNSNKERSGNEARSFSAYFERSIDRTNRENGEYTRQIRNDQRRVLLSRSRENEVRRIVERRQNSRRAVAERQQEREDRRQTRDSRFRQESNNQERRDMRNSVSNRRVEELRQDERRTDNRQVRERRNLPTDRTARFVLEARKRETLTRSSEERRTDVRRDIPRSANRERYVRNERGVIDNILFNRGNLLNVLGQRRVIREDREEARRVANNRREDVNIIRHIKGERDVRQNLESKRSDDAVMSSRRTDATQRFNQNSGRVTTRRISNDVLTYEKPVLIRSDTRRDVRMGKIRVENERFVAENNRFDERATHDSRRIIATNRDQNNLIKYEQGSYFNGFDIAKAVCVIMVIAQMVAQAHGEKSKLSFGNMMPQMPSFIGWMKQKAD